MRQLDAALEVARCDIGVEVRTWAGVVATDDCCCGASLRQVFWWKPCWTAADGDDARYRDYRDRYRAMAKTLGFDGHIAWAEECRDAAHPRAAARAVLKRCGRTAAARGLVGAVSGEHLVVGQGIATRNRGFILDGCPI